MAARTWPTTSTSSVQAEPLAQLGAEAAGQGGGAAAGADGDQQVAAADDRRGGEVAVGHVVHDVDQDPGGAGVGGDGIADPGSAAWATHRTAPVRSAGPR